MDTNRANTIFINGDSIIRNNVMYKIISERKIEMKKYFIELKSDEIEILNTTLEFDYIEELLMFIKLMIGLETEKIKIEDFGVMYK